MKSLTLFLAILITAFVPITENSVHEYDASAEEEIITIDIIEKSISTHLPVNPCSESELNSSDTCECIASGSCKFRLESSCKIVMCGGEVLEDDTNSTVDNSKIITVEQPCPQIN